MRKGWTETTLDDLVLSGVVLLGRGDVISKKDMEADPGPYPVYSSAQNNHGRIGSYNKFMFDEELITWSVDGGGHVFYRPHHKFSVTNIGGYLRILDSSKFLYPFLAAVLQKLHGQHVFDWQNKAHPSVIRKLYNNIPLASINEQKRIVDVVSSVDAYIDALQQQVDRARAARNAVLHQLLSAGGDDWTESAIGLECVVKGGKRLPKGTPWSAIPTAHPYIRATDFRNGRIDTSNLVYVPEDVWSVVSRYVVQAGDVLITIAGTIGAIALVPSSHIGANLTENAALIRPVNESVDSEFLYLWLLSDDAQRQITDLTIGTTQQKLGLFRIESMRLPLPPLVEQKRIVEIVSSMDDVIQSTEQALADAKNLRSGLLSDLLSGEHEIPAAYDSLLGAA